MKKMEKVICPWCGEEIPRNSASVHIRRYCKKKPINLTEKEIVDNIVVAMYGNIIDDLINDYLNLFSLPDLKKKYGINYKITQKLLKEHNIKTRDVSTSAKEITAKKIKKHCQEKYGVDNPSQLDEVKEKKRNTFIEHYGIDNIWKTDDYKQFTRERWNSYGPEEKTKNLKGLFERRKNGKVSNLEKRVLGILTDIGIDFVSQYRIGKYFHKYDIRISGAKVIIEVNGDFWHANPELYGPDDILTFSNTNKPRAKDVWKKDEKNRNFAEKNGYRIIYLWENEIKEKTDIELGTLLIDKLNV